jgi:predicted nucleic acid-binding protein
MDSSPDEIQVLALARRYRLTVYDAAYLEAGPQESLAIGDLG